MIEVMSRERNVLVIGGFTEGKRVLEPIANEAVRRGFGHDAGVLTLQEALRMSDNHLRRLLADSGVVTHSAGLLAVPDARKRVSDRELPADLAVVAGPEPRPVRALVAAAAGKTGAHIYGETIHPRRQHLRIVASNVAEGLAHPIANPGLLRRINSFSTMAHFDTEQVAASGRIGSFLMRDDEYFANPLWRQYAVLQDLQERGCMVEELPGGHDELLLDPVAVFGGINRAFQETAERMR